jgi:hypothetical protein
MVKSSMLSCRSRGRYVIHISGSGRSQSRIGRGSSTKYRSKKRDESLLIRFPSLLHTTLTCCLLFTSFHQSYSLKDGRPTADGGPGRASDGRLVEFTRNMSGT